MKKSKLSDELLQSLQKTRPSQPAMSMSPTLSQRRKNLRKSPSGEKPPNPATPKQAVNRLQDREWLRSQSHRDAVAFGDLSTASRSLEQFCSKLLRRAAKANIPLAVEAAHYDVAFIVHSRRGRDLWPGEWAVIGHLGTEIEEQYRLGVRWGGPLMPATWMGLAPSKTAVGTVAVHAPI